MNSMNRLSKVLLMSLVLSLSSSQAFGMDSVWSFIKNKCSAVKDKCVLLGDSRASKVVKAHPGKTALITAGTALAGYGSYRGGKVFYNRFNKSVDNQKDNDEDGQIAEFQSEKKQEESEVSKKTWRETMADFGSRAKGLAAKAVVPFKTGYNVVSSNIGNNPKKAIAAGITGVATTAATTALSVSPSLRGMVKGNGQRGLEAAREYGLRGIAFAHNNGACCWNWCRNIVANKVFPAVAVHKWLSAVVATSVPGVPALGYGAYKGGQAAKAGLKARAERLEQEENKAIAAVATLANRAIECIDGANNKANHSVRCLVRCVGLNNPIAEMRGLLEQYRTKQWAKKILGVIDKECSNTILVGDMALNLEWAYRRYMQKVMMDKEKASTFTQAKQLLKNNTQSIIDCAKSIYEEKTNESLQL